MRSLLLIIKNILGRMFKKPTTFLLHFILPIVSAIAMFMLMGLITDSKIAIGVTDLDQSELSRYYIESLKETEGFAIYPINGETLSDKIMDKSIQIGIKIPAGFSNHMNKNQVANIEILSLLNNATATWVKGQSDFILQNIKSAMNAGKDYTLENQKYPFISYEIDDVSKEKRALSSVFGIYLLLLMITTFTVSFKILDEKNAGTFSRIGLAPVHPRVYTLANILANLCVVSLQIPILLISMKVFLRLEFYTNMIYIFFVLIIFALCTIAVGVLIAASSESSKTANGIMAVILSPTCMLAGCMWPIEFMPDFLQKLAYITPQRWALDALNLLFRYDSIFKVLPNLVILLGFTTLFFLLSVYQFKNKELV